MSIKPYTLGNLWLGCYDHSVKKAKIFIFALILGGLIAFPLGVNFGSGADLLSNPFKQRTVTDKMIGTVKEGAEKALEGAKEKIHEATEPLKE